ncbi:MAG TPA: Uma2 family endonuclease [Cyanobacteria bacterium UBA11149]|nr:Uma2 family endonuclease [Cyanobacteria bacterium UBA11367]HBE60715.1 Uma2 family endonuclease [Cyanobacteria bacterium UBA11366]HBK64026.1 Uma2 family endonuclease [Cyanobacteria bacterium UBA11166]HBR74487.1 Uma2 family endonuclease [Cyanobacteria bacterium UBA11159]HBS68285.1 Uma2 family endonuclease [Cyanobacteria bacterium UBA11153]HBW91374.1 Uma2 family endonuclease [Cyanobacteria bacterium UBA11149]HCA93591.1 Uma2 family endonuclease [Cyanobacteria bacterium UBA9226]
MVIAATQPNTEAELTIGEKRVVIRGLSWAGYLQILDALPQSRGSRLTYDDGVLEIPMPLEDREFYRCLIECFIRTLIELMGMRIKTIGSTTIKYPQLKKGAEPDNAYYIKNHPLVKGRNVDFTKDPPPDLVVEVNITHTDIDKHQFYGTLGVSEFWRFNGKIWRIYQLQENLYVEVETSPTFPTVPKERLYSFLEEAKEDEIEAIQSLRNWWHKQSHTL